MNVNVIKHFWESNRNVILEKSLKNCHVEGVDSLFLSDTPEARIRMFFAHETHPLWKNDIDHSNETLSVAFHSHHCDLELEGCLGTVKNIIGMICDNEETAHNILDEYIHVSHINTGKGGFVYTDRNFQIDVIDEAYVFAGENMILKANELHTVHIKKGKEAAWLVYEGKDDPDYNPACYSNDDLTKFDTSNLYKKESEEYWKNILKRTFNEF